MTKRGKMIAAAGLASILVAMPVQSVSAIGWVQNARGWWFEFGDGNYPAANWYWTGGAWYYFDNEGYMVTGWREVNGNWYFLADSGAMVSNQWVGDYYLMGDGTMARSRYVDGYWVGSDGKWVPFTGIGGGSSSGSSNTSSDDERDSSSGGGSSNSSDRGSSEGESSNSSGSSSSEGESSNPSGGGSSEGESSNTSGGGSSESESSSLSDDNSSNNEQTGTTEGSGSNAGNIDESESPSKDDSENKPEASESETKPEENTEESTEQKEETEGKAGWVQEGNDWCYYEDGEKVRNQFRKSEDGSLYYLGGDGKILKNDTVKVNGKEYSLGPDGKATEMKEESTLSISEHTKIANYIKGNDLQLDGVITSNYTIEKITISLRGHKKLERIFNPNEKRYDLSQISFSSDDISKIYEDYSSVLGLVIMAKDASGRERQLLRYSIPLGDPVSLEADISGETKPITINEGSNFGLRGVITSNCNMEKVEGKITDDEYGRNVVMNKVVYPNSTTYDLRGEINDALKFETLLPSTYYYIVTVTANGQETDVIHTRFSVKKSDVGSNDAASGLNDAATHIRQDDSVSCTVTSVAMMIKRKALLDNNSNWGKVTLKKAKSAFWGSGGMAYSGTYNSDGVNYGVGSDNPIKNSDYGAQSAGEKRYQHIKDMLSKHPEGIVAYFYDRGVGSKQHAVLVTAIEDGTIYCLDPASSEGKSIPLASVSTFRSSSHFGLTSQDAILRLDNTSDGRMFLWYID